MIVLKSIKVMCISVDLIGILLCLLLKFDFGYPVHKKRGVDNKLFEYLVICNIMIFVTDIGAWLVAGISGLRSMHLLVLVIYYLFHLAIGTVWVLYCHYLLYEDVERLKKVFYYLLVQFIVMTILVLISVKYPILFNVDQNNIYYRSQYYMIFAINNVLYLLYSIVIIAQKIAKDSSSNNAIGQSIILLVYPILPLIGFVLQTFAYGLNLTWIMATISLLIIYFNFQNSLLTIDVLTGINNRYRFESFMNNNFFQHKSENLQFLAMLDLNRFKQINDQYGHLEGDEVLKKTASILQAITKKNDFIARIGGDEFVMVGERQSKAELKSTIEDFYHELKKYNEASDKDYQISVSVGYSCREKGSNKDFEMMLREADTVMYKNKGDFIDSDFLKNPDIDYPV